MCLPGGPYLPYWATSVRVARESSLGGWCPTESCLVGMVALLFESRFCGALRWAGRGARGDLRRAALLLGAPLSVEVGDGRGGVCEAAGRWSCAVVSRDARCRGSLRRRDWRGATRALLVVEGYEGEAVVLTGVPWPLERVERCDVVVEG